MKMKILILAMTVLASIHAQANPFSPIREDQIRAGDGYNVQQPNVEDPNLFRGKRVAILASHGVEEPEITFPHDYLIARGADVEILVPDWSPEGVSAVRFLKPTLFVKGTRTFSEGVLQNYDLVVLTGGAWNAQVVRTDDKALTLVRNHFASGRPLAAICAGTTVLINAGLAKDRALTGPPPSALDLKNAGAIFKDQPLVISGNLATSRSPNDLPQFVEGLKRLILR